ncbi:hypothetical protein FACS189413_10390 [Bacteroidia bacterium]|nr:hypothetical protein FACS189413_10390 [Bacteroidia bacterium]
MKVWFFSILCLFCVVWINVNAQVIVGAEQTGAYFPLLKNKRIAVFTNHTGKIGDEHLVDVLHRNHFNVKSIFAPEHGFRGNGDAGEKIHDEIDEKTGISIISLYKNKSGKPMPEQIRQIDVLLVDIQDVGTRFYTYYISLYKLMDACAEQRKTVILLDRPNPNGFYVDGPILNMKYKSGVGYLPIPVVHGMTLGELAQMINGEKWLPNKRKCKLKVIRCKNYTHQTKYELPVPPSPNLPNMKAIYLYSSLCLFEGTVVSLGRGTGFPFQVFGHPDMSGYDFWFTPRSVPGAKNPPCLNQLCCGVDLRNLPDSVVWAKQFDLSYVIEAYRNLNIGEKFFTPFFRLLIGNNEIKQMIMDGKSTDEIRETWQSGVEKFKIRRRPYLLYEE